MKSFVIVPLFLIFGISNVVCGNCEDDIKNTLAAECVGEEGEGDRIQIICGKFHKSEKCRKYYSNIFEYFPQCKSEFEIFDKKGSASVQMSLKSFLYVTDFACVTNEKNEVCPFGVSVLGNPFVHEDEIEEGATKSLSSANCVYGIIENLGKYLDYYEESKDLIDPYGFSYDDGLDVFKDTYKRYNEYIKPYDKCVKLLNDNKSCIYLESGNKNCSDVRSNKCRNLLKDDTFNQCIDKLEPTFNEYTNIRKDINKAVDVCITKYTSTVKSTTTIKKSSTVKVEPTPAKVEPTPAKVEPTPAKVEPTPAKVEPTPAKEEPIINEDSNDEDLKKLPNVDDSEDENNEEEKPSKAHRKCYVRNSKN